MNRILQTSVYLFIIYLIYGLYISRYEVSVTKPSISNSKSMFYDYNGSINVHSEHSTGTGTITEIFESAQKAQLDFLVITDLNNFKQSENKNKYFNKVLGISADEYSYIDSRLLYIGGNESQQINNLGQAGAILSEHLSEHKQDRKKMVILAHPTKRNYEWSGDYPPGLDGIEIINLKSLWQDSWLNKKITFVWSFLIYPFNSELAFLRLFQRAEKQNKIWHLLNKERLHIAYAGSDAESRFNFFKTPLKFPSYETLFKIVSNHILIRSELTGDYKKDRNKILDALRGGRFYMSLDMIGNPKGFSFYGQSKSKKHYMGSINKLKASTVIKVSLPDTLTVPFKVKIYKNNKEITELKDKDITFAIKEPGIYKAVVYTKISLPIPEGRKWFPWIFTNALQFTD